MLPTYGWPEIVGRDVLTGGVGVGLVLDHELRLLSRAALPAGELHLAGDGVRHGEAREPVALDEGRDVTDAYTFEPYGPEEAVTVEDGFGAVLLVIVVSDHVSSAHVADVEAHLVLVLE